MHISYIQTVSFAVASNIGHPLFYLFFLYYYTSVNISNYIISLFSQPT